jgi:hypothetical protein
MIERGRFHAAREGDGVGRRVEEVRLRRRERFHADRHAAVFGHAGGKSEGFQGAVGGQFSKVSPGSDVAAVAVNQK